MNDKMNQLNKEKKQLQLLGGVFIAALALNLLLLFLQPKLTWLTSMITLAFYILVVRKRQQDYQLHVKQAILTESFRPHLKDITYAEKNGIECSEILNDGLLPVEREKDTLVRVTMHGNYQAMPAYITDLTVSYQSFNTKSNKNILDFLSGCYFSIQTSKSNHFSCTIWDKQLVSDHTRSKFFEDQTDISDIQTPEIRRRFYVYTKQENTFVLPEEFADALLKLADYTPGTVAVHVSENKAQIFIKNRFLFIDRIPVRAEITSQILQRNPFSEINYVLRVLNSL